jgi:GTPase involved in cell partitioning and DNA repair
LGFDFLRHILKARIWSFIFDVSRYEEGIQEIVDLRDEVFDYLRYKFLDEDKNFF